jgi:hypothetical protein
MYTDEMKRAFRSIVAPKGIKVEIFDNDSFLSIRIDPKQLIKLKHDDKINAVQYIYRVKDALEQNGAIVLLVREALKNGK